MGKEYKALDLKKKASFIRLLVTVVMSINTIIKQLSLFSPVV
jgi:hypothetical protein